MAPDLDELWDAYDRARRTDPGLSAADFARGQGARSEDVLASLEAALAFEALQPPSPLVEGLSEGLVFGGYVLVRELGRGGFGLVYEARGTGEQPVAIKILNPLAALEGPKQQELLREARIAHGLEHPGIVRVLASGIERGHAWFASELVRGEPLTADALGGKAGTLALDLGMQLAEALAHAHSRGVMHGDLKPANILVDRAARVRVLDFGLARADEVSISTRGARSGDGAGTPQYMAPEQFGRGPAGPWSDVYAIGLVLLGLVAPAARDWILDPARVHERLANRASMPPRRLLVHLAPDLREIVGRALEPSPRDRYPAAAELAEDLAACCTRKRLPHGRPGPVSRRLRDWRRRPLRVGAAAVIVLVALLGVRHFWWLAPMPVYINALLSGKTLTIDGVDHGLVPTTVFLRPGVHQAKLQFGSPGDHSSFHHTIEVTPRRPRAVVLPLNYWESVPVVPGLNDDAIVSGEGAWVVFAARESPGEWSDSSTSSSEEPPLLHSAVGLRIVRGGGEVFFDGEVPHLCKFRLPRGSLRLEVIAEGYRSISRECLIDEDRLTLASFALDRTDSPWHTLVVHSPIDLGLAERIVAKRNVRLFVEDMQFRNRGLFANILYLGPEDPAQSAALTIRLELPVVPLEIQANLHHTQLGVYGGGGGWATVEAGPGPEEMSLVKSLGLTHEDAPKGLGQEPEPDVSARWDAAVAPLVERGSRDLWLEFEVGAGQVGPTFSYMQILRAESMPLYSPDQNPLGIDGWMPAEFLWHPALLIRVR